MIFLLFVDCSVFWVVLLCCYGFMVLFFELLFLTSLGGVLTSFEVRISNYVTDFSNIFQLCTDYFHGVGWGGVCKTSPNYVVMFSFNFQLLYQLLQDKLLKIWCGMICFKDLHSQQFVLTKPRCTALCEVLAMEGYKPPCQLTEEDHRSFETQHVRKKTSESQKGSDRNEP